jgi:pyruvate-ferredoxin/flavodoxin oxidoreductase
MEARARGLRPAAADPRVIGGRYGLSSKEFTPAMVKAVFDEAKRDRPKQHFTVGIIDDVTGLSLPVGPALSIDPPNTKQAIFFGLGADGTVGANKNSIKIVADSTDLWAQGYFVFDSKKSGASTVSHLRFSPEPIRAPYLLDEAEFVACHQFALLERLDVMRNVAANGTLLLNAPHGKEGVWDALPRSMQQAILDKHVRLYAIDASRVAQMAGLGRRINTVMQTCFFALTDVLATDQAIARIKEAIAKTYRRKSQQVVDKNCAAVDMALAHLEAVPVPRAATAIHDRRPPVPDDAPDFVRHVTAALLAGAGDSLPVSAFPVDGTWPVGTSRFEKRNVSDDVPVWEPSLCIQCNKCVMVCPHAAIRAKAVENAALAGAPASLKSLPYRGPEVNGGAFVLQVAPEDCTGCTLCVKVCPGQDRADPARRCRCRPRRRCSRRKRRISPFSSACQTSTAPICASM